MSREAIIGLLSIVTVVGMVWGYKFVKGEVMLSRSYTFISVFEDVSQLAVSSPVLVNGLKVGAITDITVNPSNTKEMFVEYNVNGEFNLPKSTKAIMISDGLVGGKSLSLEYGNICKGSDCAEDGQRILGGSRGLIGSMLAGEDLGKYVTQITDGVTKSLNTREEGNLNNPINKTINNLQVTMENMAKLTASMDQMVRRSSTNLQKTMANMESVTANLVKNNIQVNSILSNLNTVSTDLKNANLGATVANMSNAVDGANDVMSSLATTAESADLSVKQLNEVITKMNSGNGTLSKLLNDKALYNNLELTSKNLSLLLQDLRLNPSRYVKVSVFGGKNKDEYVKPENDPAFIEK